MAQAERNTQALLKRGSVVRSAAGHDAGSFYVVLKAEAEFVLIADGRRRKAEKPKRKNIRHISKTNQVVPEEDLLTDKKIRRALWELNFGSGSPVAC